MPFTLAHPAMVVLMKRSKLKLSLTALVAGSMVPDFENFFRMRQDESIGHHGFGILLFNIPIGLLACYLFHDLLKYPFIPNLPAAFRKRSWNALHFNWNAYAAKHMITVLLCLLAGTSGHLLWDALTHQSGLFVRLIPALRTELPFVHFSLPVFFILQVISSIAGIWILFEAVRKTPEMKVPETASSGIAHYWITFAVFVTLIMVVHFLFFRNIHAYVSDLKALLGAILYGWVIVSILKYREARQQLSR
jgi:formate-dependent nitrite reductase membrane component NrfD